MTSFFVNKKFLLSLKILKNIQIAYKNLKNTWEISKLSRHMNKVKFLYKKLVIIILRIKIDNFE